MLYLKLVMRNLKRSIKEYMIFMITMCISSMLLYSFNCIIFSEEVQAQMVSSGAIMEMFVSISVMMVIIFAWLVSYISKFMLKHRSKEFGLYLLSGMKRKTVANMFVSEMFIMGFIAFMIGSVMGVGFYQIIEAIIMKTFSAQYHFSLHLSSMTIFLTLIYYVMMWVLTLFRQRRAIMKVKIRSLLYQDDVNESLKKNHHVTIFQSLLFLGTFLPGVLLFKEAFVSLVNNSNDAPGLILISSIGLLIFSIYIFYFVISNVLQAFFQRYKKLKYQGNTLLLYGHVKGRLKSNRIVLGTLSLLTVFSLMMITFTIQYKDMIDSSISNMFPYAVQISSYSTDPQKGLAVDDIRDCLTQEGYTFQDAIIYQYDIDELEPFMEIQTNALEAFAGTMHENTGNYTYMKESDYTAMLKLRGEALPAPLQAGEFGLSINAIYKEELLSFLPQLQLSLQSEPQKLAYASEIQIGQNYNSAIIILPDAVLAHVTGGLSQYIATTQEATRLGLESKLSDIALKNGGMLSIAVKVDSIHEGLSSYLYMTFVLLYLSFVFICVQATILATQQMMDIEKNQYMYRTLQKLGMKKKEINKLLFRQIGLYFFIPLLLPLIYVVPMLPSMDLIFTNVISTANIYQVFFASLFIYLIVYVCYFLLAYIGCKRNLTKE